MGRQAVVAACRTATNSRVPVSSRTLSRPGGGLQTVFGEPEHTDRAGDGEPGESTERHTGSRGPAQHRRREQHQGGDRGGGARLEREQGADDVDAAIPAPVELGMDVAAPGEGARWWWRRR